MENTPSNLVLLGSHVTVELVDIQGEAEVREFTIVTEKQADFRAGLLGENTPLGRLLVGKHVGERHPYRIGDLVEVRILAVSKSSEPIDEVLADERRAAVQAAANQSEIINQLIFATARGSKWGEYDVDVDKLLKREDKNDL